MAISASPLFAVDGTFEGTLGVLIDITEHGQLEEEIRESRASFISIVEKNADGVVMVNGNGIVRYVNPAAETFPGARLVGNAFDTEPDGSPSEMDVDRTDGTKGVVEIRAIHSQWGGEPAVLVMLHDITERRRMEHQFRLQGSALEAAADAPWWSQT